ncbi:hypothetical protein [Paraburkholderia atlantica]|uniref:hypothetical protein n=1 Tax=Paraburkholderia atlantica TaxID=2654982 RepID=UPI0001BF3212|nr:hypothetical protein [Paraburkholderia atlantica]
MKSPIIIPESNTATTQDQSVCLEWQGLQHQSYDSVDNLLREFTHAATTHASTHATNEAAAVEVTVVGQFDGLLPLSHYLL